ncbi:S-adenosyl-L-methionine-dependent methyltransferase [Trichocladium antarcticum]|uniref:S-adenosyl-L-methionine-dependent methyltransferase n=1 Tax=Trichocladium antarcticum TaxID=1450529 RepID=A0AAN6USV9_9PEZI|nr:S-adenosyl-L-methionine-dependent methyltransferase [Trichocladium antarcticum]
MPRLPPSLFWRARREISPMATYLLKACRDLESTANELRWIREHVRATPSPVFPGLRTWNLCERRGKGVPLQYVLGTQPFGNLDIKCRPGVLIPRPETEAYTLHLASLLSQEQQSSPAPLSILDLCTGTGCIPLLLLSSLLTPPAAPPKITIHALDISPLAISLATHNHAHNTALNLLPPPTPQTPHTLTFTRANIFHPLPAPPHHQQPGGTIDLLTANPPYISPAAFATDTSRAVRNHEPRLALVPDTSTSTLTDYAAAYNCLPQDIFYARLLECAAELRPRRVFLEVGDMAQAVRVVGMVLRDGGAGLGGYYATVEIWRDEPEVERVEMRRIAGREVGVRGEGKGRGVYLFQGDV